jgi:hypothetical protein
MEETLDEALARIFPSDGRPPAPEVVPGAAGVEPKGEQPRQAAPLERSSSDVAILAAQARAHYQRALEAQRAGDWARYGEEIKKLGEVLEKLRPR